MSLGPFIEAVRGGRTLGRTGAKGALSEILSEGCDPGQVKELLLALNDKGHDSEEIAGFAEGMLAKAKDFGPVERSPLVDCCGTGGDGLHTFNFSTAAALVAAGAGTAMAKHGNRSVSSRSGSADVLEKLGVPVDASREDAARSIEEIGFGFLFAPLYHPAMRFAAPIRKELGVRTVFNLLGPLVNPARPQRQVVGVFDADLLEMYAGTLLHLGVERAMVVRGEDGMDEFSLTGPTVVWHADVKKGVWKELVRPGDVGLPQAELAALKGGDAAENARLLEGVLEGRGGPLLDGTLFNAGAAIFVEGRTDTLKDGVEAARASVRSGKARGVLEALRGFRRKS